MEAEKTSIKYKVALPPDYLSDYVNYFWTLENLSDDVSPRIFGPLADGCPGLIIQLNDGIIYDQDNKKLPKSFLYGQTVKLRELYLFGKFKIIGICFSPNILKSVFKFNAHELTDSCVDLNLLSINKTPDLLERLLNTSSTEQQIEILTNHLFSLIGSSKSQTDPAINYALSEIIQSKGNVSLRKLQQDLKLSERSFERKFDQYVGISPKLFSNVCRFQASLAQLKSNNYTRLSDIAFDNGYSDQPHFIRTFKSFAGYSPNQFQKQNYEAVHDFPVLIK
jgi:AraC-like DNA-binding protein